jgi:protein tyrosine phosphatase (PTP) superfamily phosphohydrolase (DUF442 family)
LLEFSVIKPDSYSSKNVSKMDVVRKINQELAITGQLHSEQLQQLIDDGYKAVLNLCFPYEKGVWENEPEIIAGLGLRYINLPTKIEELNHQEALKIFQTISELPKPVLIHCDNAVRSAAIVLLYIATKQGIEFEQARQQTVKLGLL